MYKFRQEQKIGINREELWKFFCDPNNLQRIMPPEMEIQTIGVVAQHIHAGQIIEYQVKVPLLGRKKWVTEIKAVEDGFCFTDVQKVGPYKYWEHKHIFQKEGEGTLLIDEIKYDLPLGIMGVLGNMWLVNRTLKRIFKYRAFAVGKIWGLDVASGMGRNE
jgi:ligand-binding SRPBCC domain-containing protein